MMSDQNGVLVQADDTMILEVVQVANLEAKLSDFTLRGGKRGAVKIMVAEDQVKWAWGTGMSERFQMFYKRI